MPKKIIARPRPSSRQSDFTYGQNKKYKNALFTGGMYKKTRPKTWFFTVMCALCESQKSIGGGRNFIRHGKTILKKQAR